MYEEYISIFGISRNKHPYVAHTNTYSIIHTVYCLSHTECNTYVRIYRHTNNSKYMYIHIYTYLHICIHMYILYICINVYIIKYIIIHIYI